MRVTEKKILRPYRIRSLARQNSPRERGHAIEAQGARPDDLCSTESLLGAAETPGFRPGISL